MADMHLNQNPEFKNDSISVLFNIKCMFYDLRLSAIEPDNIEPYFFIKTPVCFQVVHRRFYDMSFLFLINRLQRSTVNRRISLFYLYKNEIATFLCYDIDFTKIASEVFVKYLIAFCLQNAYCLFFSSSSFFSFIGQGILLRL